MKAIKKVISLLMVTAMICMMCTNAFAASSTIRQNVSSSAVTCNASDGNLPSNATVYTGNSYYFNLQVSNNLKLKTATLYIIPVGGSSYVEVYSFTAKNYFRYTSGKYNVGNTAGTLKYRWRLTYTDGSTALTSKTKVTVNKSSTSSTSSSTVKQNVSSSTVTCNASDGNLPGNATVYTGNSYYFNLQVSNNLKLKTATLYIIPVGGSSYSKVYSYTANNYFRYTSKKYSVGNTAGTLKYYWKLTYTNGSTASTSKTKVTVNKNSISSTMNSFISDSRWKNGISWTSSQTPKLSSHSAWGCAAYCADFAKYVFGKDKPQYGTSFTNASNIKAGDILYMKNGSSPHWIVVLSRSGNTLYTAEGNASSKVVIKNGKYSISGSKIKTSSTTYSLVTGYHYQ